MNAYVEQLKKDLSYGKCFDVTFREVITKYHKFYIVFLNFLINNNAIVNIIYSLNKYEYKEGCDYLSKIILNEASSVSKNYEEMYDAVLNGNVVVFVDDEQSAIISEVRNYPTRSISEPDSEKVVRGSRDGFTENIAINIGLIRRRIKTGKLITEKYIIGNFSRTLVSLVYIEDKIDKSILNNIRTKIKNINVDELTMSDKALEELLINSKLNVYPLVKYTERPDTFASHLYQGMFGILVDTSPNAILGPVSIFDHMQHAEEFRQTKVAGSYLRITRYIGIILSFLVVPLWFSFIDYKFFHLSYFGSIFEVNNDRFTILVQLLLMELGIELIRMASIHTPNALSTSMGLIAGVIIGEMAINMEILSPQIVLLGSISAIGSYITPSYELSLANKIIKILIIILVYLFNVYGLIFGLIFLFIYLYNQKSFSRSYLYPLIPFNSKKLKMQIFRKTYKNKN